MKIPDRIVGLRRVRASDLIPHPLNWRKHTNAQASALRSMFAEVGFVDALIAREVDGGLELLDGHLRAETAPTAEVPVLIVDLSDEEAAKVLATLDPISAMASADADKLDELLDGIEFVHADIQGILGDLASTSPATGEVAEDAVPEPPDKPVSQPGDLWVLGRHRLLCGDATSKADVRRLLGGSVPLLMVTDQPYGVEYEAAWRIEAGLGNTPQTGKVENDDRASWCSAFALFPGDVAYVWHAGRYGAAAERSLSALGFEVRAQIIWVKPRLVISRGHYHWRHEPCLYAVRESAGSAKWNGGRKQTTVWADVVDAYAAGVDDMFACRVDERTVYAFDGAETTVWEIAHDKAAGGGHSTQKPVECMARPIRNHGGEDDAVYDPFVGSGTTLIAAEQLGRRCFAMELSPRYCDVVVARWEALTGRKARRHQKGSKRKGG